MTPNFALSLSVDGLVLLHRVPNGWHRVADVSIGSDTLSADMAAMLKAAQALEGGDVRTKLILPHDQIKFLAIETALTSQDDINAAVSDATPLGLDEIIVDFDRNGGRTHIAAVAKQTIQEAETFARDHGFEPVSCVAVAEPYTFSGEVFFGPTTYAREELGIGAELSREAMPPVENAEMLPAEASPETAQVTPAEEPVPSGDDKDELPVFASRNRTPETDEAPAEDATPIIQFTRREQTTETAPTDLPTPVLAAPKRHTPTPVKITPPSGPPAKDRSASEKTKRRGLFAGFGAAKTAKAQTPPPTATDAALARGVAQSHVAGGAPKYLGVSLTVLLIAAMGLVGMWANRQVDGGVASLLEVDPGLQEDTAPVIAAPLITTEPEPAPVVEALAPEPTPAPVVTEEETPPTPIVTAVPGRVLSPADAARIYAATGVWQRAPRLPGQPAEADQSTLAGLHDFAPVDTISDISRPAGPAQTTQNHELPILAPRNPTPPGRDVLRDADGFILASASGTLLPNGLRIYGRAPALRPPARPTDEVEGIDDAALPSVPATIVTELQFVSYIPESDLPPARAFRAPSLSQPSPLVLPNADAPRGFAGARFITPPPAVTPEATVPEVEDVAATPAIVPEEVTPDTDLALDVPEVALPADDGAPSDTAEAETEATVPEQTFVEVIQGAPPVVPPLRPGSEVETAIAPLAEAEIEQPASEATPLVQDPTLAGFRPIARPTDLAPASVATFEAIPELAGIRPLVRPASLAPIEESEAPVIEVPAIANGTDISAIVASIAAAAPPSQIINPTRSAIALSPRPDLRPTNFARVVASAQTLQQRQNTRAVAASTSAAVVPQTQTAPASAPATGGQTAVTVARAATVDSALRLRDMNLIGVYGKPGARRALVRMPNGRFVKVEVGSNLDGGRVTAIGDSALNFVKRGQTYALQLPAG